MLVPKLRFKREDGTDYPEWKKSISLKECSDFITKGATPTTYGFNWEETGVPFFRNDAIKNNKFVYGDYSYISEQANAMLSRSEIRSEDILIAITGEIGKVGIVPYKVKKGNINQHLARIRIQSHLVPYFTYQYLCTDKVQNKYKRIKTGLSMSQLSLEQIRDTLIPNIEIEEQQKIADFLSTVDEVIAQSEAEVQNLEQQKKAAMQKIFSQEVRFKREDGSEYPEWEEKKIGEVFIRFATGLNPRDNFVLNTPNASNYYVTIKNFEHGVLHLDNNCDFVTDEAIQMINKRSDLQKGDILLSSIGRIGDCYLIESTPKNWNINESVFTLRPNQIILNPLYAFHTIHSDAVLNYILKQITGSTFKSIKMAQLKKSPFPIPCLEEQQKIADFLSAFDEAISYAKQELDKWKELKKGLLQQMFV